MFFFSFLEKPPSVPPVGWREPLFSSASGVEGLLGTSSFTKNSINTLKIWAVNILLTVVFVTNSINWCTVCVLCQSLFFTFN